MYTIERAGVFDLAFDVPAGYDVREVRGEACRGAPAVQVDSHHLEGADKTPAGRQSGPQGAGLREHFRRIAKAARRRQSARPDRQDVGTSAAICPRAAPDTIERTNGRLVVYAAGKPARESRQAIGPAQRVAGRGDGRRSGRRRRISSAGRPPVSSFVYTKAPVELSLLVERRKPYVSVGQLLVAQVDPGVVKYDATFFYDIRYSGVKSLRIDVPAESGGRHPQSTRPASPKKRSIRRLRIWPRTPWLGASAGEGELLGPVAIHLSWERPLENLEVGKSVDLPMPHLVPSGVDRAWGQIVLVKAETIDLLPSVTPSGLRPIDPQHDLMPGANVPDAAQAFEFQDDWSLTVAATRYQLEAVKHTSIERGLIRAVVTRGGQVGGAGAVSDAQLAAAAGGDSAGGRRVRHRSAADRRPADAAGKRRRRTNFSCRSSACRAIGRFCWSFATRCPRRGTRVDLPAFPDEPAVQKVYVSVFLPEEQEVLGLPRPVDRRATDARSLDLSADPHRRADTDSSARGLGARGSFRCRQSGRFVSRRWPAVRVQHAAAGGRRCRQLAADDVQRQCAANFWFSRS